MKNIIDDFEDIRRRMKREPQTFQECDNQECNNKTCNCGHPENHAICDRWDCIHRTEETIKS